MRPVMTYARFGPCGVRSLRCQLICVAPQHPAACELASNFRRIKPLANLLPDLGQNQPLAVFTILSPPTSAAVHGAPAELGWHWIETGFAELLYEPSNLHALAAQTTWRV